MIYINSHRNTNKYHTTECREVKTRNPRKITDPDVEANLKEARDHCKFCTGEYRENLGETNRDYLKAAMNADPEEVL